MLLKYVNSKEMMMTEKLHKILPLVLAILVVSMVVVAPAMAADSTGGAGSLLQYQH